MLFVAKNCNLIPSGDYAFNICTSALIRSKLVVRPRELLLSEKPEIAFVKLGKQMVVIYTMPPTMVNINKFFNHY